MSQERGALHENSPRHAESSIKPSSRGTSRRDGHNGGGSIKRISAQRISHCMITPAGRSVGRPNSAHITLSLVAVGSYCRERAFSPHRDTRSIPRSKKVQRFYDNCAAAYTATSPLSPSGVASINVPANTGLGYRADPSLFAAS